MAESPIITTLRTKRDQIEGLIAHLEDRIKEARTDLAHVNATLRLFEMDGGACCPRTRSLPLLQRQPAAHCSREHASSKDLDLKRSSLQDGAAGRQINFEACLGPKSHLGSPRSTNSPYRPDDAHQISITGTQDGSDRPPMISRNRCGRRSAGRSGGWVGGRSG